MAEPALGMMPSPRPPMLGTAPPPVPTARPQAPGQSGGGMGSFVTLGKEVIRIIIEMATLRREKATQLSALAGQMTDLIEEEAQASSPEGMGMSDGGGMAEGPPMPRTPFRSPIVNRPPDMPMGMR